MNQAQIVIKIEDIQEGDFIIVEKADASQISYRVVKIVDDGQIVVEDRDEVQRVISAVDVIQNNKQ